MWGGERGGMWGGEREIVIKYKPDVRSYNNAKV